VLLCEVVRIRDFGQGKRLGTARFRLQRHTTFYDGRYFPLDFGQEIYVLNRVFTKGAMQYFCHFVRAIALVED